MSHEEFVKGVPEDNLVKVFENGEILVEQTFKDVQSRARITEKSLDGAMRKAVDNLDLKLGFFQKMTTDEAIAVRLSEAACGSKWKHPHATHLADIKKTFPQYATTFDKIGVTEEMNSVELLEHVKKTCVCEKKAQKSVFRALSDDDPEDASKAMDGKWVITM